MKKPVFIVLLIIAFVLLLTRLININLYQPPKEKTNYIQGSIIVIFREGTYQEAIAYLNQNKLKYQLTSNISPGLIFFGVTVPTGKESEWINKFKQNALVIDADFDYINTNQ